MSHYVEQLLVELIEEQRRTNDLLGTIAEILVATPRPFTVAERDWIERARLETKTR